MSRQEIEPVEQWYPAKKLKEHLEDLQGMIDERRESKVGDYHPITLLEEVMDEIFAIEAGESRWGDRLKALRSYIDEGRDPFVEEGAFEEARKDIERQLDILCCEVDDKIEDLGLQIEDAVSIEDDLRPTQPLVSGFYRECDIKATPEDLKEIARQAYELVRYLDGEAAEIDTEDLRFRLRRLGFWVAPVQQRGAA